MQGKPLPLHVQQEFADYLKCGRLEHGFLRVQYRYFSRPAVSEKRLSLTPSDNIRYQLKTPYCDETTHVIFEPLDYIAKLAVLVPKPRVNLTRFHGVFAPNSKHRRHVTPARREKGNKSSQPKEDKTHEQCHQAMTWAQRLKWVFNIDVSIYLKCGGEANVIACIEDYAVIDNARFLRVLRWTPRHPASMCQT